LPLLEINNSLNLNLLKMKLVP